MASRYSLVFYGSLVVAAAATYGVYRVVETAKAGSQVATAPVVVATRDIAEGTSIDRTAVSVAQWPTATVPAGAYGSIDSVAGRVARVAVFTGEPIVPGRLAPEGTGPGLEVKITPGKRAMGVRINEVSGISGMILPGSRVDILLLLNRDNAAGSGAKVGKLFMENMRILAMGTSLQRGSNGEPIPTTVATLEVTPEESERLLVAQSQGQIQLTLRGYGDPDTAKTSGASVEDVVGMLRDRNATPAPAPARPSRPAAPAPKVETPVAPAPSPVKAPARPDSLSIKIYRGRNQSEQKFQKDSAARRDTNPA